MAVNANQLSQTEAESVSFVRGLGTRRKHACQRIPLDSFSKKNKNQVKYLREQVNTSSFENRHDPDEREGKADIIDVLFDIETCKTGPFQSTKRDADREPRQRPARQSGHDPMSNHSRPSPELGQDRIVKTYQKCLKRARVERKRKKSSFPEMSADVLSL